MTWIESHLEELAADGYFDDLPGSGRPIRDIGVEYSPTWWAERWMRRDATLRDSKELRGRLVDDVQSALKLPGVDARRRLEQIALAVNALNAELDTAQALPTFDIDSVLIHGEWRI